MPFTSPADREKIKLGKPDMIPEKSKTVGDLCSIFYDYIMTAWRNEQRWRTAHRLYDLEIDPVDNEFFQMIYEKVQDKFELKDVVKAAALAYKVFFELHVMDYERKMREKNGDI